MILQGQGSLPEARRRYEEIMKIDPRAAVAANNLAYIYAEGGGNLDVALQLAQTAKERLPDVPEVNDTLGFVYLKKELPSLALPPFQLSAEKDPANPVYHYHLGLAFAQNGETAKAKASLTRALALSDNFPGANDARQLLANY